MTQQATLPFELHDYFSKEKEDKSFHLIAESKYGFFGLTELNKFIEKKLTPNFTRNPDFCYILDFSTVKAWDISAILWLIIGLHHYKESGIIFKLRLPESKKDIMSPKEVDQYDKSADYLRRWKFDEGLRNITYNPSSLFVDEQKNYFDSGPRRFYLTKTKEVKLEDGLTTNLISRNLAHIFNLVDVVKTGPKKIDVNLIEECVTEFEKAKISHILSYRCNIDKKIAKDFSNHLIAESLLNILEHPNATIGMLSVSVMGQTNELILTVADNGGSIAKTIYEVFLESDVASKIRTDFRYSFPEKYDRQKIDSPIRAKIIDYATKPGVTSKKQDLESLGAGLGLTYIKEDAINIFKGKLFIVSDELRLDYSSINYEEPEEKIFNHPWNGNLLRISIALANNQ